ncbi:MAG: O-antigen ligase family protein [Candidatus Mcinerneyibacterium aminivorans]|uniref:O-antigen ligase family protein n=1 Tax=Candidatus Mcinerneyibacterium aminivorans TaxID=2703815 RepID=A0A5D0MCC3_9BACT|nr:MAG: O-antigen ligase family protein [Candidatus Mcinerneyibacterium aminivorans]
MNIKETLEKYKIYLLIPFFGVPIVFNSIFIIKNHSYIFLPLILIFLGISLNNIKHFPYELLIAFIIPLLSLLYVKDMYLAFDHFYFFFLYISLFIIFYNYKYKERLYNFLIIYSIILFLYVLYQNFYIYPYLLKSNMINEAQRNLIQIKRLMGTFSLPNIYAFFSLVGAYLSFYMFNKKKNYYYIPAIIINLIAILLTKTFIAFVLLMILALAILYKNNKKLFYYSFGGIILLILIFLNIRGISSIKSSFSLRYFNYKSALNIFWDNPLTGVGVNNFDIFYPVYKYKQANIIHNAHSLILQSLTDLGILGILFLYFLVKNLYKNRKSHHFILLIVLFIYFATDMMFYIPSVAVLYWILISINTDYRNKPVVTKLKTYSTAVLIFVYLILSIMVFYTPDRFYVKNLQDRVNRNKKNENYYSYYLNIYELNYYFRMDKDNVRIDKK